MKRHAALIAYSREHHTALVLAKQAQRLDLTDRDAVTAFMAALPEQMQQELEPHFQQEESQLLPLLQTHGATALAERTLHEHRLLRSLAQDIEYGHAEAIPDFGLALEAHVRFEERELFPLLEKLLAATPVHSAPPRLSLIH